MAAVLWVTGSDLYVETIDLTFKESMEDLQKFFSNMFPNIPFTTEIKADESPYF